MLLDKILSYLLVIHAALANINTKRSIIIKVSAAFGFTSLVSGPSSQPQFFDQSQEHQQ
jgi:hypothetical protein